MAVIVYAHPISMKGISRLPTLRGGSEGPKTAHPLHQTLCRLGCTSCIECMRVGIFFSAEAVVFCILLSLATVGRMQAAYAIKLSQKAAYRLKPVGRYRTLDSA